MSDVESDNERTGRTTLRVLRRRTPVTSGWRAGDIVRRSAVRRRTWWITGTATVLAAAVATALSLHAGGTAHTAPPRAVPSGVVRTISGPDGSVQLAARTRPFTGATSSQLHAVVAAEQRLGLALLRQVGRGTNVTVSPASLYLALGMLQNGARGATADEISKALQATGISTADQNAGLAALTNALAAAAAKDGIEFASANSLWQQKGFPVKQGFLDTLAAYYRSGVRQVDFAGHSADAVKAINAWTSANTHGKITKLFDSLDPSTVLVLANALYFHAKWQTPFVASQTKPGTFTTSAGKLVTVRYMNGGSGLRAAVTDVYQAVGLPYRGGRFQALAVMPTKTSLGDFVKSLTPEGITAIADGLRSGHEVALPRFTTTSTTDLVPVLKALGMHLAFGGGDLSGLSDVATAVDQVIQRDYLQVGEKGTTAAAVTGISIAASATVGGPDVQIDHPFLFLVRDTQTGAILFASEITDPAAGS